MPKIEDIQNPEFLLAAAERLRSGQPLAGEGGGEVNTEFLRSFEACSNICGQCCFASNVQMSFYLTSMEVLESKLFSFGNCKFDAQGRVDDFGLMVLRLKNYADSVALEYFFELVNSQLEKGLPVTAVPSSTAEKTDSGIMKLAKMLSQPEYGRIDATSCLVRKISVKPNHMGGERSIAKHLNSIEVVNQNLIKGQVVILLDDVYTSGNTLVACTQLLIEAGAAEVKQYALLLDV